MGVENHHPAIIDSTTFRAVQEAMALRTKNHYRGQKKYDNFYSGLMVCGDCGSPMFPMSRSDLKPAYRCGNYHKHGVKACSSHHIKVEVLDSILKEYLKVVRNTCEEMIRKINIETETETADEDENPIEKFQKLIAETEEERKVHLRQKAKAILKDPDKETEIEEYYDELINECTNNISGYKNQIALFLNRQDTVDHINEIAKTALDIFDDTINKEKLNTNDLLLIIDKIIVYKDTIEIKLRSDIDAILNCGVSSDLEGAANFNSGTVDIESFERQLIQMSRNHRDKVYCVNVISNGDPLEIYTDTDGEVIFKKYSPIGELSSITAQYADVLARGTGLAVVITDRDSVIACAGISKKEVLDRRISQSLENIMERRENYVCCVDSERIRPVEGVDKEAAVICPIIGGGDISGALVMLLNENGSCPTQTETKLAQIAATFLGKQMEE